MARYIQHPITLKLIPADEYVRPKEVGHAVHGDIEPFISPVDGTVISDRKQLAEHNKRNNVVSADEFSPQFLERKKKEREDFFTGNHSKEQQLKRRQEIYENWTRAEREHGY